MCFFFSVALKKKDSFESIKKILGKDLFSLALQKKSTRSGKGKLRGRKYKSNAGMLLVLGKDEKLKVLLPTLRQKKRFVRIKIISEEHFEFKELSEGVNEELLSLLGSIDFGIFGVWILRDKFDEKKQEFLLRVSIKGKASIGEIVGRLRSP